MLTNFVFGMSKVQYARVLDSVRGVNEKIKSDLVSEQMNKW